MVRRYKDLGRITTAPAQRTNYNINVPRNIGAEARINAIKQAGAEISSTLFNIAKDKAVIQAEEDSSKAQIQYINGVPQFSPMELGGTIYNKAYNDAAKLQYKNALENSINKKITEAKNEYFNNPELRNNTDNLRALLEEKINPMRENVANEFKNVFDVIAQDKIQPAIQTDLKENANRSRTNKIKALNGELGILQNQYTQSDSEEEKEEIKKTIQDLWANGRAIIPELYTEQFLDEQMLNLKKLDSYKSFRSSLFKKDENGEFDIPVEAIQNFKDALNSGADTYNFNGKEINIKDFYNSDEQRTAIDNELTKYINERNKNDISDILIKNNILDITTKFTTELNEKQLTTDELNNLVDNYNDQLDAIDLGTGAKSIAENTLAVKSAKLNITQQVSTRINQINKNNITDLTNNAKSSVSNNIGNFNALSDAISKAEPVLKLDADFINLKKWNTEDNNKKWLQVKEMLMNSSKEKVIEFVNAFENGNVDTNEMFGNRKLIDVINELRPIQDYILPGLKDMNTAIGTLSEKDINLDKIQANLRAALIGKTLPHQYHNLKASESEVTDFIYDVILEGDFNTFSEEKGQAIMKLLDLGYKSKFVGDIIEETARTGNVDLFNNFTATLVRYIRDNNTTLESVGLDKETYGIMKTLLARRTTSLQSEEEVKKVFTFINQKNSPIVKEAQATFLQKIGGSINKSDINEDNYYSELLNRANDILAGKVKGQGLRKYEQAVEYQINSEMINYMMTGRFLSEGKKDFRDNVIDTIETLSKDDIPLGKDVVIGTSTYAEDFTASTNQLKDLHPENPYREVYELYKDFSDEFGLEHIHTGVLTQINVIEQIKQQGGVYTNEQKLPFNQINWNAEKLLFKGISDGKKEIPSIDFLRKKYSYKTIAGDFINNTQEGNLIDTFSLDTNDGQKVPALMGKNIKLFQNDNLLPNQYHVIYNNVADGVNHKQVIRDKDNNPVIITAPEDYTDILANANNQLIYKSAREQPVLPGLTTRARAVREGQDIRPGSIFSRDPTPSITSKLPSLSESFSDAEKNIINYDRGKYAFGLNISIPYRDVIDNYIVEKDNKFYLLPSTIYAEKEDNTFGIVPISKEEAFARFSNTKNVAIYNTLASAQRARDKIREVEENDYKVMNE